MPFIANWPGVIPKVQEFTGLVSSLDIAATSVALAGADNRKLDGVNLLPFLQGTKQGGPCQALFWCLEEASNIYAVRTVDYKYMKQPLPNVGRSFLI
ncbi:hypothetical protein V6260_02530 [Pseudoalteromonas aliena]|uniref:hypothetical protein n=1 Tax=Pseudoalteromonas aliena TaxID=247523 RepID=UPI00311EFF38